LPGSIDGLPERGQAERDPPLGDVLDARLVGGAGFQLADLVVGRRRRARGNQRGETQDNEGRAP
jgi:hypothetical protein